ncbi:MAG: hypothetical protein ABEL76_02940 [Bradymonadaceae bacterium]
MSQRTKTRLLLGGILLVTAAVYLRAVGYEPLTAWDDGLYLVNRETVRRWWSVSWYRRLATPKTGYPTPVPTFVYAQVRLLAPEAYPHLLHGLQIGLHLVAVGLVFVLARRWLEGDRPALIVAALWALHPVAVESVVWLSNLKTVLAAVGLLGAMALWERRLDDVQRGTALSVGIFALWAIAVGSRSETALLPVLLFAQSVRRLGWRRAAEVSWRTCAPMVAVAAVVVLLATTGHGAVMDRAAAADRGLAARTVRIFRAVELSIRHLLLPVGLQPGYFPAPSAGWVAALPGAAGVVSFSLLLVAAVRSGWTTAAFGMTLTIVLYAPYSNLMFLPRWTADTYLYLPAVGASVSIVAIARRVIPARDAGGTSVGRRAVWIAAVGLIAGTFALLTHRRVGRWRDELNLWAPVLREQPRAGRPYRIVAWALVERDRWRRAADVLDRGLPIFRANRSYPYFYPEVLTAVDRPRDACRLAFEAAARVHPRRPAHDKVLLETAAEQECGLPTEPDGRELLRRAVDTYRARPEWMSRRDQRMSIADYLTKRRLFEPSLPFVRRELETAEPHCFTWIAADRMPERVRSTLDLPPRPARCRGGTRGGGDPE